MLRWCPESGSTAQALAARLPGAQFPSCSVETRVLSRVMSDVHIPQGPACKPEMGAKDGLLDPCRKAADPPHTGGNGGTGRQSQLAGGRRQFPPGQGHTQPAIPLAAVPGFPRARSLAFRADLGRRVWGGIRATPVSPCPGRPTFCPVLVGVGPPSGPRGLWLAAAGGERCRCPAALGGGP